MGARSWKLKGRREGMRITQENGGDNGLGILAESESNQWIIMWLLPEAVEVWTSCFRAIQLNR